MRSSSLKNSCGPWLIGLALSSLLLAQGAQGDLGALVAQGNLGEDRITILAAPSPLRVGKVLLNLSLQPEGGPANTRNTDLTLTLKPPGDHPPEGTHHHSGVIHTRAQRQKSTHPGMLGALVELPTAGTWQVEVSATRSGKDDVFLFDLEVGPPASPWVDYAMAFAFPVVGLLIFVWHQRRSLTGARRDTKSS